MRRLLLASLVVGLVATVGCAHSQAPSASAGNMARPSAATPTAVVKPGLEVLLADPKYLALLESKRVGLITNQSGVDHQLNSTIDLLHKHPKITLAALFAPEHGVRGDHYAGDKVDDSVDPTTGIPVYSMYGKTRRPKPEWLADLDVMVYDIQDVGSRSYTFIYTMSYGMQAAAERGIPFVVLDRPNPAGAHIVDGNILDPEQGTTFVGMYPIAYQYGMTPGEAAQLFNAEFHEKPCELHVVPMQGYRRDMLAWETGLPYVLTSVHVPQVFHATYYNLTGILGEIPHIQIGVGFTIPFETVAAPWIDRDALTAELRSRNIPGLGIRPITYKPRYAAYKDEVVQGVHLIVTDYDKLRPVEATVHLMTAIQKLYPEQDLFGDEKAEKCLFDEVWGDKAIRQQIRAGKSAEEIIAGWQEKRAAFATMREKYLIYR